MKNPAYICGGKSKLINLSWEDDKYPDTPLFTPRNKITVMDVDGPGMIVNIHCSDYYVRAVPEGAQVVPEGEKAMNALWITVYYDRACAPAIDMPLDAFFADCKSLSEPFATEYFSKVKKSHNFYLTMPFRQHIRIEIENRSDVELTGYLTIQYEALESWEDSLGYLYVQHRTADLVIPDDIYTPCEIEGNGILIAHWMHIEASHPGCWEGNLICEANDEFYIDGEKEPSLEYLGTEDFYGYSWGFQGMQSDGRSAITCEDEKERGDIRLTMLRCRDQDKIRFLDSCRLEINYRQEFFSKFSVNPRHVDNPKETFAASMASACYFYLLPLA